MDDQMERFALIKHELLRRTGARRALQMMDNRTRRGSNLAPHGSAFGLFSNSALDKLLRHHLSDPPLSLQEIRSRDCFDDLLQFFSVAEVACACGFIESSFSHRERMEWLNALKQPALERYYKEHYAIALPARFRDRLLGSDAVVDAGAESLFPLFYDVALNIVRDDDLKMFLWLLDDGEYGDYNAEWLFYDQWDAASLSNRLFGEAGNRADRKYGAHVLLGVTKFLRLADDVVDLLRQAEPYPRIRREFWQFHSYWFAKLNGKAKDRLASFFRRIESIAKALPQRDSDVVEPNSSDPVAFARSIRAAGASEPRGFGSSVRRLVEGDLANFESA